MFFVLYDDVLSYRLRFVLPVYFEFSWQLRIIFRVCLKQCVWCVTFLPYKGLPPFPLFVPIHVFRKSLIEIILDSFVLTGFVPYRFFPHSSQQLRCCRVFVFCFFFLRNSGHSKLLATSLIFSRRPPRPHI